MPEPGQTNSAAVLDGLLEYCHANRRVCPKPDHWNRLFMLLPGGTDGEGKGPRVPLILGAWGHTTDIEKRLRLAEHVQWAQKHGAIGVVQSYICGLSENHWHHIGR